MLDLYYVFAYKNHCFHNKVIPQLKKSNTKNTKPFIDSKYLTKKVFDQTLYQVNPVFCRVFIRHFPLSVLGVMKEASTHKQPNRQFIFVELFSIKKRISFANIFSKFHMHQFSANQ
jgi:hypothetical protein